MKIPIFVSCATTLTECQKASYQLLIDELNSLRLEARTLGRTDYPTHFPLGEVHSLASHCAGGLILGFEQYFSPKLMVNRETEKYQLQEDIPHPTPWNQLEAGILFSLGLPLLVFKEPSITGGVFDEGVSDLFIHSMPRPTLSKEDKEALREVFLKWDSQVRHHYYCHRRVPFDCQDNR